MRLWKDNRFYQENARKRKVYQGLKQLPGSPQSEILYIPTSTLAVVAGLDVDVRPPAVGTPSFRFRVVAGSQPCPASFSTTSH